MSNLIELLDQLRDTTAALARLEREAADYPDSPSSRLNMDSLEKRKARLEEVFREAASEQGLDVCTYRLLPDERDPTVTALAKALSDFQGLFTTVYDAIRTGPKIRARLARETVEATSFGFAYTFPGSLGVVMTLQNEALLLGESEMDRAMSAIFEMAQAQSSETIATFAKRLGAPPVRKIYSWAKDHAEAGLSVAIEWRRGSNIRSEILIQVPEMERLRAAIDRAGEETAETVVVTGVLRAADLDRRRFRLEVEGGEIAGTFQDAISTEHEATLPKRYVATLRKTTRVIYALEEDIEEYQLLNLRSTE